MAKPDRSRQYISINRLENFLLKCKDIFAPISHTHTWAHIKDFPLDITLNKNSTNAVSNSAVATKIEDVEDQLKYKVQLVIWEEND